MPADIDWGLIYDRDDLKVLSDGIDTIQIVQTSPAILGDFNIPAQVSIISMNILDFMKLSIGVGPSIIEMRAALKAKG